MTTDSLPRKPIPLGGRPTSLLKWQGTHTVCEESRCPNREECSRHGLATFLINGPVCTRRCSYCNIATGKPDFSEADELKEVETIATAVRRQNYRYVVITAVNRDDRSDGGARQFQRVAAAIAGIDPEIKVEFLVPDFRFKEENYQYIVDARPYVVAHNLELVPRLFKKHRPQGNYEGSLKLLKDFKARGFLTKTALITGFGESLEEVQAFITETAPVCDIITIGQYLSPGSGFKKPEKIYTKEEWARVEAMVKEAGFRHHEVGPFVRSSYMAHRVAEA